MKNCDLERAKKMFGSNDYTCVLCKGKVTLTSAERGIRPLLNWLNDEYDVKGFSVVDRVVGKAAAFLYILLEVKEVYAGVMSEAAVELFAKYGIQFSYEVLAEEIINRKGDGICPMEQAVTGIDIPKQALRAVMENCRKLNITM